MPRSGGKKAPKATKSSAPNSNATVPSTTEFPSPFVPPSHELTSNFLSTLSTSQVYILHIDSTDRILKRRVFLVPVCMNLLILAALALRLYYALPVYIALLMATLGHTTSPASVDTKSASSISLVSITVNRTMLLLGDYLLFAFVGSWPWGFLFGTADTGYSSPAHWRWAVGFQNKEIIVRSSKKWSEGLLSKWNLDDELTLKYKIIPATSKEALAKSGYLLLDKDWALDFAAMVTAHELVAEKKLQRSDFETAVVAYHRPSSRWMMWELSKLDKLATAAAEKPTDPKTQTQRDTILRFKDKLTRLGQEDLFYRWIELVQYESSMPGGFTEGRQAQAMRDVKRMFDERGIDFAKFWEEIGGQKGMPGLEG